MKEAAYKCYTQEHQKRFFSPKKFSCKKLSETKGTVQIENKKYYINYLISKNYISSFANKKNDFKMVSNIFFNEKKEELTKIIDNKIRALFPFEIQVKKNEIGIPFLYKNEEKLPFSVSKSHHGNYAGFAISESL